MSAEQLPPQLEERFHPPDGWQWGTMQRNDYVLRYGCVEPPGRKPDAIVVGLQGANEFCEKYFELARDLTARNFAFWMLDWRGQGKSDRYLPDHDKRHSLGFEQDIADLHDLIANHILPQADGAPLVMLAHSMGGNIGLRYLQTQPDIFSAAAFSAPMNGLNSPLRRFSQERQRDIALLLRLQAGSHYALGGGPWKPAAERMIKAHSLLSNDPTRALLADAWYRHDPALRIGGVTWRWVYEAVKSCAIATRPDTLAKIGIPVLIAVAGQDRLVDNERTAAVELSLPVCRSLNYEFSRHEILMERDAVRDDFLDRFCRLAGHDDAGAFQPV